MKRFLFLTLAFMQGCVAYAASPGTAAFNANQFSTNNNRISIKDSAVATNLVVHGTLTSDSSDTGSEFFGDGGSFGYRITPQTMSGFINFIPDTSAQTGVPYHTNTGTNVVETHLSLASFGYGIWTENSGIISAQSDQVEFDATGALQIGPPGVDIARIHAELQAYRIDATHTATSQDLSGKASDGRQWYISQNVNTSGTNGYPQIILGDSSRDFVILDPSDTWGGSAPFVLNSVGTKASGNLVEFKNHGTNVFAVPFDGAALAPSIITTNITIENNITVKGNAVLNVFTAQSGTVSNALTLQGGANITSGNLTNSGTYVGTINGAAAGTTLTQIKSLKLQFPRLIDGAGCTYANTNDYTALTFMLPQFSGTAATNANYCDFAFRVPTDLDTSVDLTASLTIRLTAADTAAHTYDVGMVSIANSGAAAGTPATYVALTVAGDGSGASGDIEGVSAVTLTSWKSNLTAGQWCLLRLNRDGANDASTVASNLMELEIFYTSTQ